MAKGALITPTAGLRGAFWDPARLPDNASLQTVVLETQDGKTVSGFLLARGGEEAVAVIAHPREHLVAHYLAAELVRAGVAVFLAAPRLIGNDIRLEHEIAIYDLAAAMTYLRSAGFKSIVAVGNSGGGPLWAFYNQQALLAPAQRIARAPGGRPTRLENADLPVPDAIILVSSHLGQGKLLMNGIDPSITDESDPFSIDPSLNPFDAANGYAANGEARYDAAFIAKYTAAQVARVERIDAYAHECVKRRAEARKRVKGGNCNAHDKAIAAHTPIFPLWRTDADLRCLDLSLDPSDRHHGSLWGTNPYASNYGSIGFGRLCTPESWLSTWSGLSSAASMERCAPAIEQPVLVIEYTGDASTFPSEVDTLYAAIGSSNKERAAVAGDHHGRPIREGQDNPKVEVGAIMADWLQRHVETIQR